MQWTEIQKITCLLSSCTNSHFSVNYLRFCGVGASSSIIAVVLLYSWQSKGIHDAKLAQCLCLGYMPWDQPPDSFQEWVGMPEFILVCLQTSELLDLGKKNTYCISFSLTFHIKLYQWFTDSSMVVFPATNAFLSCYSSRWKGSPNKKVASSLLATSACRYLSYFLLLANLFMKGITRGLLKMWKNLSSCALSLHLSCIASYQRTLVNMRLL